MSLIEGTSILRIQVHSDSRGELIAFDATQNSPFVPRRVFFIRVDRPHVSRGGHANSCDEFIVALNGSVVIHLDNGFEECRVRLTPNDRGLWVRAGVVIHLEDFAPGTTLFVCASADYDDTRHFDRPQPHLFMAEAV